VAEQSKDQEIAARFCVLSHSTLAAFNERTPEQVIRAQRNVDDDMLGALESMVRAARAGRLEGADALAQECVAW
jgi:hypothetical protein